MKKHRWACKKNDDANENTHLHEKKTQMGMQKNDDENENEMKK